MHVPLLRVPPGPPPSAQQSVQPNAFPSAQPCALPSVPPSSYSSYTRANFPKQLYDNVEERNALFYDYLLQPPTQVNQNNSFLNVQAPGPERDISVAPRTYYNESYVRFPARSLGDLGVTPNLYDDVVRPGVPTRFPPDLNRSGEPFSTTAMDPTVIPRVTWTPHAPCEVAPRHDANYWVPGLDSKLYERTLINGAQEQPYANFNRNQALINLLDINIRDKSDLYTRPLSGPTYCETVKTQGQPAASVF